MFRHHLTRNLRSLAFLLLAAAVAAAGTMLWWANRTGLPDSWRAWIEQGAVWESHWAFVPLPAEVKEPQVRNQAWPRNAIDRFILARLEAAGIRRRSDRSEAAQ